LVIAEATILPQHPGRAREQGAKFGSCAEVSGGAACRTVLRQRPPRQKPGFVQFFSSAGGAENYAAIAKGLAGKKRRCKPNFATRPAWRRN
jgi:hypothetical protein